VDWLNFEQDMGLANFRRTKLSYRPVALLSKFRVRLREPNGVIASAGSVGLPAAC
jgi:hypothetical protein